MLALRNVIRPLASAGYRTLSTSTVNQLQVTVCGGGNAAHVAAGMFSKQGADVNLYFSFEEEAQRFREGMAKTGSVTVKSKQGNYEGVPKIVTSDPAEAIPGSDLILIITPAFAHEPILKTLKPHLTEGTILGAIPAPGGFDLLAKHVLGDDLKNKDITLFGGSSLPWACRFETYGSTVSLLGAKTKVPITAYPNTDANNARIEKILNDIHITTKFPVEGHFLVTTLWPTNCIIHTGISYGIWHDWDGKPLKEAPLFYQNCNEFTGNVLFELSNEIMACKEVIERETGVNMGPLQHINDYQIEVYGHCIDDTSSTARIFATNDAFRGLTAPTTKRPDGLFEPNFNMRYMTEDLPHGLAVLRNIAELCNVKTPMMDTVLTWCQKTVNHEYLVDGKIQGKDIAHSGCPARFGITTLKQLVA